MKVKKIIGDNEIILDTDIHHENLYYNDYYKNEIDIYTELLSGQTNSIIFDVGANIGFFSLLFSKFSDLVHTFEPVKEVYDKLEKNTRLVGNIINNNVGISDVNEISKIHVSKLHNQGSTLKLEIVDKFKQVFIDNVTEEIQLTTIDYYCDSKGIDHINLIKLDIEGNEFEALIGAKNMVSLNKIDYIIYESYIDSDKIKIFLKKNNYVVSNLGLQADSMFIAKLKTKL